MTEFDEVAKINNRGTSVLQGLTASLREGMLTPNPGGGFTVMPSASLPPVPGQEVPAPAVPSHVLLGNSLLVTFEPGERAMADGLVEEINETLEPLRKKLKGRFLSDLRKVIGK